ncbi:luciferase domain-containing protein [Schumannella luteola]
MDERPGPRPEISTEGPQRQLTQRSSAELWGRLVAETFSLPGTIEGHSAVSPASSRAVFLEIADVTTPETSLAPDARLEPIHLHGVDDTSIHLCLPRERASEVIAAGWAQPHQFGDFGTEVLVYGPRDESELEVALALIRESLAFARAHN